MIINKNKKSSKEKPEPIIIGIGPIKIITPPVIF